MSEELDRLAELEAKATPGPWRALKSLPVIVHGTAHLFSLLHHPDYEVCKKTSGHRWLADCAFTAAIRNAAPALLAAAREAEELREWQRDAVPWLRELEGLPSSSSGGAGELRGLLARVKP